MLAENADIIPVFLFIKDKMHSLSCHVTTL